MNKAALGAIVALVSFSAAAQQTISGQTIRPNTTPQSALIDGTVDLGGAKVSGVVPSSKGGAGAVNGIVKANGSGTTSAAVAGTDYAAPTNGASGQVLTSNGSGGFGTARTPMAVATTTGAARSWSSGDIWKTVIRSNSGSAMSDTLPSAASVGANWFAWAVNFDTSGALTLTPSSGYIGTASGTALLVPALTSVLLVSDGSGYQVAATTPLAPGAASVTTLTASGQVLADSLSVTNAASFGSTITLGAAISGSGGSAPSFTNGTWAIWGDTANGMQLQGVGSSNDLQIRNGGGSLVCGVGHGLNTLSCQQVVVTGTSVTGNGLYRPASTQLGFMSNSLSAGLIDSGQHWRLGGSGTPTLTTCGTGATVSGNDMAGLVTLGTSPGTTCTVNFNKTADNTPRAVTLTPANSTAAAATGVYVNGLSTTIFSFTGTGIASGAWYYRVGY